MPGRKLERMWNLMDKQLGVTLSKEYCAAVNLEVEKWIKEMAINIKRVSLLPLIKATLL
jgi:hypothetical protein